MTPDERSSMSTLNNFFHGMHVLVGMADVASSALLRWEISHFNGATDTTSCVIRRKGESGIVCSVRTACKALSKHGSEQSGVYQSFTSYLVSNGIKRNPLAPFRGNRFNILFYDAGILFYISDFVISFFRNIWQTPNQLLNPYRTTRACATLLLRTADFAWFTGKTRVFCSTSFWLYSSQNDL